MRSDSFHLRQRVRTLVALAPVCTRTSLGACTAVRVDCFIRNQETVEEDAFGSDDEVSFSNSPMQPRGKAGFAHVGGHVLTSMRPTRYTVVCLTVYTSSP